MFRFAVEVLFSLEFVASVTFGSATEIIVLSLRANPSSIRKIEISVRTRRLASFLSGHQHVATVFSSGIFTVNRIIRVFVFKNLA